MSDSEMNWVNLDGAIWDYEEWSHDDDEEDPSEETLERQRQSWERRRRNYVFPPDRFRPNRPVNFRWELDENIDENPPSPQIPPRGDIAQVPDQIPLQEVEQTEVRAENIEETPPSPQVPPQDARPVLQELNVQVVSARAASYASRVTRRRLADEEFADHTTIRAQSPVIRHFFTIDAAPINSDTSPCSVSGLIHPEQETHCVFCRLPVSAGQEQLTRCEHVNKRKKCESRFHIECGKKYNADKFHMHYSSRPQCQNQILCPLHCCATCNAAGRMQTAYTGEVIECGKCLRAFHIGCMPEDSVKVLVRVGTDGARKTMVICGRHDTTGYGEPLSSQPGTSSAGELPQVFKEIPKYMKKWVAPKKHILNKLGTLSESGICDCKGPLRCTTDKCKYFFNGVECPPVCVKDGAICGNRLLSDHYPPIMLEKFKTEQKGYGVRALRDITRGECIIEMLGELIDRHELNRRQNVPKLAGDLEGYTYAIQTNNTELTIDSTTYGNEARLANHSCDPNAEAKFTSTFLKECYGTDANSSLYIPRVYFVALKDIERGEEVTIKYNMSRAERAQPCYCESTNCCGSMTGRSEEDGDDTVRSPKQGNRRRNAAAPTKRGSKAKGPSRNKKSRCSGMLPGRNKGNGKNKNSNLKQTRRRQSSETPTNSAAPARKAKRGPKTKQLGKNKKSSCSGSLPRSGEEHESDSDRNPEQHNERRNAAASVELDDSHHRSFNNSINFREDPDFQEGNAGAANENEDSPMQEPEEVLEQVPGQFPVQDAEQLPNHVAMEVSDESFEENPPSPQLLPQVGIAQVPEQVPDQVPVQNAEQPPNHVPVEIQDENIEETPPSPLLPPRGDIAQVPEQVPDQILSQEVVQQSDHVPMEVRDEIIEENPPSLQLPPQVDIAQVPDQVPVQNAEQPPNHVPVEIQDENIEETPPSPLLPPRGDIAQVPEQVPDQILSQEVVQQSDHVPMEVRDEIIEENPPSLQLPPQVDIAQVPDQVPVQNAEQLPNDVRMEIQDENIEETPPSPLLPPRGDIAQVPEQVPDQILSQEVVQQSDHVPMEVRDEIIEENPPSLQLPPQVDIAQVPDQVPVQNAEQLPNDVRMEIQDENIEETPPSPLLPPRGDIAQVPEQVPDQIPSQEVVQQSDHVPMEVRNEIIEENPPSLQLPPQVDIAQVPDQVPVENAEQLPNDVRMEIQDENIEETPPSPQVPPQDARPVLQELNVQVVSARAASYASRVTRRRLADEEFADHTTIRAQSPVIRHFFTIDAAPINSDTSPCSVSGLIHPEQETHCVFCRLPVSAGQEQLTRCEHVNKRKKCESRFHIECGKKYNADKFHMHYSSRPQCQNQILCPLHCCATCNAAGRMQTAYTGEVIECGKCLRAFHIGCMPEDSVKVLVRVGTDGARKTMVICGRHDTTGYGEPLSSQPGTSSAGELPQVFKEIPKYMKKWVAPKKHILNKLGTLSESGICDCKGPLRCTTDDCKYFFNGVECPPVCVKDGAICGNRLLSDHYPPIMLEKFKTKQKGYGVKALRKITRGECIIEMLGELIDRHELNRRQNVPKLAGDLEGYTYAIQTNNTEITIDSTTYGNEARLANHSCDPNAEAKFTSTFLKECYGTDANRSLYIPRVYFVALKDIKPGEEVTIKYNMSRAERAQPCYCESTNCCGSMTGRSEEDGDDTGRNPTQGDRRRNAAAPTKRRSKAKGPSRNRKSGCSGTLPGKNDGNGKEKTSNPKQARKRQCSERTTNDENPAKKSKRGPKAKGPSKTQKTNVTNKKNSR